MSAVVRVSDLIERVDAGSGAAPSRVSRVTDRDRQSLRRIVAPPRRRLPPRLYGRICEVCETPFQARRPEAKTCSARCRREKNRPAVPEPADHGDRSAQDG